MTSAIPFPPAAERHEESRRLYLARDLDGYMGQFGRDLVYIKADGSRVSREQLTRDVADQFRRLGAVEWTSQVESEERAEDTITETVHQTGIFVATAFGVVHRRWELDRRAKYTWRLEEGKWRISEVRVLEERMTDRGTTLGARPKP